VATKGAMAHGSIVKGLTSVGSTPIIAIQKNLTFKKFFDIIYIENEH